MKFNNYLVLNETPEVILYLFINDYMVFKKYYTYLKTNKKLLIKKIRNYIKENKINYKGNRVNIVIEGIVTNTLLI